MKQDRFEVDIRINARQVLAGLGLAGFLIFVGSYAIEDINQRALTVLFALVVVGLVVAAWNLAGQRPEVARWLTLGIMALIANSLAAWFGWQAVAACLAAPVLVAAAMISLPASILAAGLETIILLGFGGGVAGLPLWGFLPAVGMMWLVVGVMAGIYLPILQVVDWTGHYYREARVMIEETRAQKIEFDQTVKDLEEANGQLVRLNKLAHNLRQVAEDARAAKAQFVANVSHELRTPLNMITGFTEMILQSPETYGRRIPKALLADLAVIQRNAEHLKDLIDDVLDLSQIEADQMALSREYVNFNEILNFAVMAVRPLYELKKIYLKVYTEQDLPAVFCDQTRIREVLLNLLSNAGRFTEQGGVEVRVWAIENHLLVSVVDTGLGIAPNELGKLFRPFQQLDGSMRRRYGGTGLGLAISKQFIELHDGKIWVDSRPGIGTTFTFSIPIAAPVEEHSEYARWFNPYHSYESRDHIPNLPKAPPRPRIIVVERGEVLLRMLKRYLRGVETVQCASIAEAICETNLTPAQVVLVNSASIQETLSGLDETRLLPNGTPLIICSVPGVLEASANMEVENILVKPITREKLLDCLTGLGIVEGTILIVDDEPDALQLFGRMLASAPHHYRVLLARDGLEAVNILQDCRPDVMLLDLVMPNMDGFQLLAWRHENPEYAEIPVVIISARNPVQQPIVSSQLAVVHASGFSVRQLLASVELISRILSPVGLSGDSVQLRNPDG